MTLSDQGIYDALTVLIALTVSAYALWALLALLRRAQPDLLIGRQVAIAFGVRIAAAVGLSQLAIAQTLRGGDELTFLGRARDLAQQPIGSADSLDALTTEFHTFLFSLNDRLFDPAPPDLMLRVEMVTFSVIGITLLAAAVHELAGARAGRITAWVIALEPANVFFSSLLHKEPLMFLAEGAVVYGGAVLWKRGRLTALVPIVLGALVATATRPYVGWFLAAAATLTVLHASITRQQGMRALALSGAMIALILAFVPAVWNASSDKSLEGLQASQDANAADDQANLSLERVDYSTREKLITNLPKRLRDIALKPYPWQTQNTSQRLGVIGSLVVLFTLGALAVTLARNHRDVMSRAGPLIYPAAFMLIAYSLSAGNAGTAFRYRTHVVALALALLIALRQRRAEAPAVEEDASSRTWQPFRTTPTLAK